MASHTRPSGAIVPPDLRNIVDKTAQFVAKNGPETQNAVANKHAGNPIFNFLNAGDPYHPYYQERLSEFRLRSQEHDRKKIEDEIEQRRVEIDGIDWQDFYVVETIDFDDDDDVDKALPPPMTLEEVIRRIELGKQVEMEMDEDEMQVIEEGMEAVNLEDEEAPMRPVKSWNRPEEDRLMGISSPVIEQITNFIGSLIPCTSYTPPNGLQYLAPASSRLPAPPPHWLQNTSIRPPPPAPMSMIPDQQLQMALNRLPMMPSNPPLCAIRVPPPSGSSQFTPLGPPVDFATVPGMALHMPPAPPEDAPDTKQEKLDDTQLLIPEEQFLSQHPGPVRLTVSDSVLKDRYFIPKISVQSLSETVGSLKEKISRGIRVPANRLNLIAKSGILKDNLSLAYYNLRPEERIFLSVRERGDSRR